MRHGKLLVTFSALLVFLFGCLRTRSDLMQEADQKKEMKTQLSTLQQTAARDELRFQDYETQFRVINGKVESLEHQLNEANTQHQEVMKARDVERLKTEERLKIFEEALRSLEARSQQFSQDLEQMRREREVASSSAASNLKAVEKGTYKAADEAFTKKEWKTAIVSFQKYREGNPKGKNYASATFKIGVCFKELGMNSDAKPFFEEVVEKFPKAKEAVQAKSLLKSIK